jgi:hypothetical protein
MLTRYMRKSWQKAGGAERLHRTRRMMVCRWPPIVMSKTSKRFHTESRSKGSDQRGNGQTRNAASCDPDRPRNRDDIASPGIAGKRGTGKAPVPAGPKGRRGIVPTACTLTTNKFFRLQLSSGRWKLAEVARLRLCTDLC